MAARFLTGGSMPLSGILKRAVVIASCVSFAVMPLAAAPAAAPNPIPGSTPAGASHPNVVILVAADGGFSDVGSFGAGDRSEETTSELQSLWRSQSTFFGLKKKK